MGRKRQLSRSKCLICLLINRLNQAVTAVGALGVERLDTSPAAGLTPRGVPGSSRGAQRMPPREIFRFSHLFTIGVDFVGFAVLQILRGLGAGPLSQPLKP